MLAEPYIPSGQSRNGKSLTTKEMVTALLWSGSGNSFQRHAGQALCMSQSSVKVAVDKVINLMHKHFVPKYIQLPTSSEALDSAQETQLYTGFPPIAMGFIDGTQVRVKPRNQKRKKHINRHGAPALSVTLVTNQFGRIISAISNCKGKAHDASVLRYSGLWDLLENQKWRPFEGAVFLGDSAYMTKQSWLATPYHDPIAAADPRKKKYNKHFKKARNTVEQVRFLVPEHFLIAI